MSPKRARRGDITTTLSPASSDAPASRAVQNPALQLPTELIYIILAISMGEHISDMMLYPSKIQQWDAILTFLHVSRAFRGCSIKLLYYLWGNTFIRERTRYGLYRLPPAPLRLIALSVIGNYKPTHSIFRQLTHQARSAPHSFTSRNDQPKLLSARVVRHPISPLARIWSTLIHNTATANAALQDAEKDWGCVEFEGVYTAKDLQMVMDSYAEIPEGIRPLLLGRVVHWVMRQAAIWTKRNESYRYRGISC